MVTAMDQGAIEGAMDQGKIVGAMMKVASLWHQPRENGARLCLMG